MKSLVTACFLLGVSAGWWWPEFSPRFVHEAGKPANESASNHEGSRDPVERPALRQLDDQVEIPRDRLMALLEIQPSTALYAYPFAAQEEGMIHTGFENLANWAGLDPDGRQTLKAILRDAADARRRWEVERVRVKCSSPNRWQLQFPGDDGNAKADLKRRLEAAFGPETAASIHLAGDLDNFFGLPDWAPGFKHGSVEIELSRLVGEGSGIPDVSHLFIKLKAGEHGLEMHRSSAEPLSEDPVLGRFAHMIDLSGF